MKERTKELISRIGVAIFTLIADLAVAYSLYYIIATPEIPWWWCIMVALITGPILYIFNKYSVIGIKEIINKKL